MLFEQGSPGTKETFLKAYGPQPLGRFIRCLFGLELNAAKQAFGEILHRQTLNAQQIRFLDTLINYLSVNGLIEPGALFEPPFTEIHDGGIVGLFDEEVSARIVELVEGVNGNAGVG
jgi:type I restriction enzyme, R subunit